MLESKKQEFLQNLILKLQYFKYINHEKYKLLPSFNFKIGIG